MPNLEEFFKKPEEEIIENKSIVKLGGIRACKKCDMDIVGALWNEDTRIMTWTCHSCKYENTFEVD